MFHCAIQVDHPAPAPGANVIYTGMAVDKCTSIPPSPPPRFFSHQVKSLVVIKLMLLLPLTTAL